MMTMTTLLEPPTIFAVGKPPNTFQGDAPSAPSETDAAENESEREIESEGGDG
jgi:hypothetical protein